MFSTIRTFQRRTMATAAQDPIQKLFIDQLKKASKSVYKAGAVSNHAPAHLGGKRRWERETNYRTMLHL